MAIKILTTSQNTWVLQMKVWNWSRLSETGCFFFFFLRGVHVFCMCLKCIDNMCSYVPRAQQMLLGEKKTNAKCAFFLKYGYGEYEHLINCRKGDFCFEVMGIKTINDSLLTSIPRTSHWDQTVYLTTYTHKHFHFVQTSSTSRQRRNWTSQRGTDRATELIKEWE